MSVNLVKHTGGCHCGKVRFEVLAKPELRAYDCNCSICVKKGMKPFLIPKENFNLLQGEDNLSCYTYNTHQAKHFFCKTCGIHSFYTPRTSPDACGISPYCLDEGTVTKMDIIPCDAKNWEKWQQYLKENPKAADCTENTS
ncbi:unnamed protein product [Porites lobata]|uniref:CENP-V/GFA domain-containing protein n=1 Tax=Porites lobata TaxID=104759 RepID=A0ABN8NCD9_9CNID|nr:unnamed protein product [Porites lobata]